MAKSQVPKIRIALKLPAPVPAFISRANNCHDQMAANAATFPSPSPALTVLSAHIADLTTKEAATKTRTTGAVAARDAAKKVVSLDLIALATYVEGIANADLPNAAEIATKAGMFVKQVSSRNKPTVATKPGKVSGALQIIAKVNKGEKAHDWQFSTDAGKTWIAAPTSTQGKTTLTGLTAGSTVMVRHRAVTKVGPQDWSDPVSAVVS